MDYNFKKIENKWKKKWEEDKLFATEINSKKKFYALDMFPYPSGAGLHVGHPLGYIASDIFSRYKKLNGFNVLHPMGFDSFGLPAEQYAIATGQHPEKTTKENSEKYKSQLKNIGLSFDWSRELKTSDHSYYKWTQWIFKKLFESYYCNLNDKALPISQLVEEFERNGNNLVESPCDEDTPKFTAKKWKSWAEEEKQNILLKYRLAFLSDSWVNWCEELGTVLANDEVKEGLSIRGGHPVEQKKMKQWSLRITAYANRLLSGLNKIDWPNSIKEQQKNWIGKSSGVNILFDTEQKNKISVFTTRPETIFGVSFLVLSPEHELIETICTQVQKEKIKKYQFECSQKSELDRISNIDSVSGEFTGSYAIHPFSQEKIPIWISDYVLTNYGSGAIMAVPAHDSRDFKFAKKFKLEIVQVIENGYKVDEEPYLEKAGEIINSSFINGLSISKASEMITNLVKEKNIGHKLINFRLRDAIFSRQRYWGEPFPVYYKNEIPYLIPDVELPLKLPSINSYLPTKEGNPPLARAENWKYKTKYRYEHSTMPGWAGSSWYFIRYIDPKNNFKFVDEKKLKYWGNVDLYIGGAEHATGHLLYSRFWTKFLYDLSLISFDEPFQKIINQGMILGESCFVYRIKGENTYVSYNLKDKFKTTKIHVDINLVEKNKLKIEEFKNSRKEYNTAKFICENENYICGKTIEKMSKSFYNVVNPDDIIEKYGADSLRLYEMFLGPLTQYKPWNTDGITGVYNFIKKFWNLFHKDGKFYLTQEDPSKEEKEILHYAIHKIKNDIETFSFNTCVSTFMITVNKLKKAQCSKEKILKPLIILLSPFCPFVCEELWNKIEPNSYVYNSTFPKYDIKLFIKNETNYPVAINGKRKLNMMIANNLNKDEIEKIIYSNDKIKQILTGCTVKKIIIIPEKIINIVINK